MDNAAERSGETYNGFFIKVKPFKVRGADLSLRRPDVRIALLELVQGLSASGGCVDAGRAEFLHPAVSPTLAEISFHLRSDIRVLLRLLVSSKKITAGGENNEQCQNENEER
jgi:hypothetical protein